MLVSIKTTLELIEAGSQGNEDAINELHDCRRAKLFVEAMKQLVEQEDPRDALLMIGRHYMSIPVRQLGEMFNLDHSRVIQITNKYVEKGN